jgi:hypothetical protein
MPRHAPLHASSRGALACPDAPRPAQRRPGERPSPSHPSTAPAALAVPASCAEGAQCVVPRLVRRTHQQLRRARSLSRSQLCQWEFRPHPATAHCPVAPWPSFAHSARTPTAHPPRSEPRLLNASRPTVDFTASRRPAAAASHCPSCTRAQPPPPHHHPTPFSPWAPLHRCSGRCWLPCVHSAMWREEGGGGGLWWFSRATASPLAHVARAGGRAAACCITRHRAPTAVAPRSALHHPTSHFIPFVAPAAHAASHVARHTDTCATAPTRQPAPRSPQYHRPCPLAAAPAHSPCALPLMASATHCVRLPPPSRMPTPLSPRALLLHARQSRCIASRAAPPRSQLHSG